MTRIGFAGLGRMGTPMASNLANAGFELVVWNRTRAKAERFVSRSGAELATTPQELAERCEIVITMLADDDASRRVYRGDDGLFAASSGANLFIEMGTISPGHIHALTEEAGGRVVIDAPVSGSIDAARDSQLLVMVGAEETTVDMVRPVLSPLARKIVFLGQPGAGATMKLAVNLLIHSLNQALAEALSLTEAAGIETSRAYTVMESSAAAAPMLTYRRQQYLNEAESPVSFSLGLARKDVGLALDLAEELALEMPQAQLNYQQLGAAEAAGLGERDMAAMLSFRRRAS